MKINFDTINNLVSSLSGILEEKPNSQLPSIWLETVLQKVYAFYLTFGLIAAAIGLFSAYMEGLTDVMIFVGVVYGSGSIVFILDWEDKQKSLNLFLVYLYTLGNGLMLFSTDGLFGILWLFSVPVLATVFNGKFKGLLSLGLSVLMLVFWGAMASMGNLKWDLGTFGLPWPTWAALLFIFVLALMSIIIVISSLIESYSELLIEKEKENKIFDKERQKVLLTNKLLEQEINHSMMLQGQKEQSDVKFKTLFNAAQDMYVIYDHNGSITDVNNAIKKKLGYTKDELVGTGSKAAVLANLKPINVSLEEQTDKINADSYKKGDSNSITVEGMVYDFEGQPFIVEFSDKEISVNGSQVTLSIIRDITHRKQVEKDISSMNKILQHKVLERTSQFDEAMQELRLEINTRLSTEAELRKTKDILEQNLKEEKLLSEMKTRFVAMISHEYRTPLTIIYTCADILELMYDKRDRDIFDKNISKIKGSVGSMIELLEDVLIIGRNEVKKIDVFENSFDAVELLREIQTTLTQTDEHKHELTIKVNSGTCYLQSDINMLRYIIRNLVTNAQKYSPPGSEIILELVCSENQMELIVTDKGIGVPQSEIPKLYEPFFRSSNVEARSGTGLGLAICKEYTEVLGAQLDVESVEGEGSSFTLTVPKIPGEVFKEYLRKNGKEAIKE